MYTKENIDGLRCIHKDYLKDKNPIIYTIRKNSDNDNYTVEWDNYIGEKGQSSNYILDVILPNINDKYWIPLENQTIENFQIY